MITYRQGAVAPDSYVMVVQAGSSGVDMTTVSAASFKLEAPGGSESTLTTALSGATTSEVTLTYAFTGTTPFAVPGVYKVHAVLTVPSGSWFSEEAEILVKASHEV